MHSSRLVSFSFVNWGEIQLKVVTKLLIQIWVRNKSVSVIIGKYGLNNVECLLKKPLMKFGFVVQFSDERKSGQRINF